MSDVADAAAKAGQIQYALYNETRNNLAPYKQLGDNTAGYYAGILGVPGYDKVDPTEALQATPGYNWMFNQGMDAVSRSAASKGMLNSGAVAQGLTKFGQGLASQTYGDYMNRLYSLITGGQNAATQQGQFASNYGNSVSNTLMDAAKTDQMLEQQNQGQEFGVNSLLSSVGLLGGMAMAPMTGGASAVGAAGSGSSLISKLYNGGAGPWG